MPFCNKCGSQHQDEAQFCPNCGNIVAQKSGNATQSEHIGTTGNNNTPALWNPKAAVWWSLLFLPLGPILHSLNWEALGKKKEAKEAKKFFIIFCVFLVIIAFIPADYVPRYLSFVMFFAWGMWGWGWFMKRGIKIAEEKGKPILGMTGKGQIEYVAEKYGTEYKRKSWLAPLAISFGILIVNCILVVAIESFYEEIGISSQYIEDDDAWIDSRDGKAYKTIKIGTQTWMAENLNYEADGSKCYENNPANCQKYGRLYNWQTALKACPSGWHLPDGDEWQKLVDIAGGDEAAGANLKAASGWNNNGDGSDGLGFSALPGGGGYSDGSFYNVGDRGYWWSTSEYNSDIAYGRGMFYDYVSADWLVNYKSYLFSVRCVQD